MMIQEYHRPRLPMILALSLCCLMLPSTESFEFGSKHVQQLRSPDVRSQFTDLSPKEEDVRIQHKRSDGASNMVGSSQGTDGSFLTFQKVPAKLVEARQHGKTVLECSAAGRPAPSLSWYKDGQPLIKVPEILFYPGLSSYSVQEQDETSLAVAHSKLELDCVTEKDAGYYECVASQGKATETVGVQVRVASYARGSSCQPLSMTTTPPVISMHYQTYMLEMGFEAHLKCVTIGRHATFWLGPDEQPITDNEKFKTLPDGSLIIHDLNFNDMGAYVCVAKNKFGHAMAETFVYPVAPMY